MAKEINLLPIERRASLDKQARLEAFRVGMRSILLALLLLTVVGGALLAVLSSMVAAEKQRHGSTVSDQVQEFRDLRDEIALDNEFLQLLVDTSQQRIVWSDRLLELFESLPPGVQVKRLQVTDQPPVRQLVFSGTAVTRNALIVLEKRLQELNWVVGVEAPVSNLISRTDADYVFTIRVASPLDK